MFYRKAIVSVVTGIVFAFTLTAVSASESRNLAEGQKIVITQASSQHNRHEHRSSSGMMDHMSGRSGHGGYSYAHMIATHADELNLSDAQLGRIVRLNLKHAREHKQFKKTIRKSMMAFHHASMKSGTDDNTLRKLGDDHVKAFKAMIEQHIRNRSVVHAILTSEQKEQLKTMKMNHSMHGKGHGKGHGGMHIKRFY